MKRILAKCTIVVIALLLTACVENGCYCDPCGLSYPEPPHRVLECGIDLNLCSACYGKLQDLKEDLLIVVNKSAPYTESRSEAKQLTLVSRDKNGRICAQFFLSDEQKETVAKITGNKDTQDISLYIMCQKIDGDYVYCYEDACYVYGPEHTEDAREMLRLFKELNDWGKSINESKLIAYKIDRAGQGTRTGDGVVS